jgi:hypothetical protein
MTPGPMASGDAPRELSRAAASRVARWLLDKERPDEAVALLAAWAANGPNDAEGQNLLAEALRVNPASPLAKLAFERMEGITGDQAALDEAIVRWSVDELRKLEREIVRPAFLRAQVGFNNNVKYKNRTFHIQTEDSGLDKPHVITHLFADGGRVIKSHKRTYGKHTGRDDVAQFVRKLMKGQQLEMALSLRDGKFDEIIEGRAHGGMEVLTHPPRADVRRLATQKESRVLAGGEAATETTSGPPPEAGTGTGGGAGADAMGAKASADARAGGSGAEDAAAADARGAAAIVTVGGAGAAGEDRPQGAGDADRADVAGVPNGAAGSPGVAAGPAQAEPVRQRVPFRLNVVRSLRGGPIAYEPEETEAIIGSAGTIVLPGEVFCHPREAAIRYRDGRLWLFDFEAGNGVFLRIKAPVEVEPGAEFIVGDQLLRVERNPVPKDRPGPGPTYFYSSPKWLSSFRVVQIFERGALGACVVARGTSVQIGSTYGDFVFPSDPLVSDQHCLVEEQAGALLLTDLGSRTGVFVRIKGEQELVDGDELLVGRTRMSVQGIVP